MRALKRHKRLLILPGIRQRAPVSAEQSHVPRIADRGLFQDRHGLGTLVGCPQCARVGDRNVRIVRVLAIAVTKRLKRASEFIRAQNISTRC